MNLPTVLLLDVFSQFFSFLFVEHFLLKKYWLLYLSFLIKEKRTKVKSALKREQVPKLSPDTANLTLNLPAKSSPNYMNSFSYS